MGLFVPLVFFVRVVRAVGALTANTALILLRKTRTI